MGSILSQERKEHPKFQFPNPQLKSQFKNAVGGNVREYTLGTSPPMGLFGKDFALMLVVLCGSLSEFQINPVALSMPVALVLCKCGYITSGLILVPNQFYFFHVMTEPRNSAALKLLGDKPV